MDFQIFRSLLIEKGKHQIIICAFYKLNDAREQLKIEGPSSAINEMIWKANSELLWYEQSEVVQPLFDKLSGLFSSIMTFFASFDYKINHHQTVWKTRSRFILFMLINGFSLIKNNRFIPEVTNLEQRWFWISNDLLKKWKIVESDRKLVASEIQLLSQFEDRKLVI